MSTSKISAWTNAHTLNTGWSTFLAGTSRTFEDHISQKPAGQPTSGSEVIQETIRNVHVASPPKNSHSLPRKSTRARGPPFIASSTIDEIESSSTRRRRELSFGYMPSKDGAIIPIHPLQNRGTSVRSKTRPYAPETSNPVDVPRPSLDATVLRSFAFTPTSNDTFSSTLSPSSHPTMILLPDETANPALAETLLSSSDESESESSELWPQAGREAWAGWGPRTRRKETRTQEARFRESAAGWTGWGPQAGHAPRTRRKETRTQEARVRQPATAWGSGGQEWSDENANPALVGTLLPSLDESESESWAGWGPRTRREETRMQDARVREPAAAWKGEWAAQTREAREELWFTPLLSPSEAGTTQAQSPASLNAAEPAFPLPSLPLSDTNPNAQAPADPSRSTLGDSLFEPFPRSSPLCLDGKISDQSKYVVASGGYADVWTGSLDNKTVAIKVMRPFSESGSHIEISKIRKRSWREYLAWSRLSHRNILDCLGFSYDFSPQTGQPSLISPWMSNGTATKYIREWPNVDRVEIVLGIARGLTYLHNRKPTIVHGDLRAGNVLISDRGTACLSDFGLSKILSDVRGMTTSSELAGSLRWMAPELLRGSRLSVQSDVWAYGMTVLEIFTGTRPYSEATFDAPALLKILKGELPVRPRDVPIITDDVWNLCHKCWQLIPEQRPPVKKILAEIKGVRRGGNLQ